ncbi:uncharacterized protein N7496_000049 [Penicillium cataractarum]|uniref:Uncharacterized protein n=1 Tax=Penicillium cataractarum TaxID=2100454 RepID=A0A9W9VTC4_9EURO|nr:uncharacterized protein N7496_000049 [Penicillium cataractarum]KAJ5388981.1 hypothetical protein N7496_000049 [Penicillium cataractarum]
MGFTVSIDPAHTVDATDDSDKSSWEDESQDDWAHVPDVDRSRNVFPSKPRVHQTRRPSRTGPNISIHASKDIAVQTEKIPYFDEVDVLGTGYNDFTVHLDLETGLDINADIEQLSRLNQLGHFNEAISLFHERLARHVDFFPVTAEYADLLLEQGSFGDAHAFLTARLRDMASTFSELELRLLGLLKSFAEIYTKGALIPALQMTKQTLEALERESDEDPSFFKTSIGQHIHLVETCLRIISYAAIHSSFLGSSAYWSLLRWDFSSGKFKFRKAGYFDSPTKLSPGETPPAISGGIRMNPYDTTGLERPFPRLGDWYSLLVQEGYMWESHRLLRVVLPLIGDSTCHFLPDKLFEKFFHLKDVAEAKGLFLRDEILFDEDRQILTELANATLIAEFLNSPNVDESVKATQRYFFEKVRSTAVLIASTYPKLLTSRPYLHWLYLEEAKGMEESKRLNASSSEIFYSLTWSQDDISGIQSSFFSGGVRPASFGEGSAPAATTTTSSLETSLRILIAVARQQEDYKLQIILLQVLLNNCSTMSGKLEVIRNMSHLSRDVMKDAGGYLQCLIAESRSVIDHDPNPRDDSDTRMSLYSRITEFNEVYPSHFDFRPEERLRSQLILFDIPILVWLKHLAMEQLLRGMSRDTEAEVSRVRLPQIERHLPYHVSSRLGATHFRCTGCVDCNGDTYSSSYYPYEYPTHGGNPYVQNSYYTHPRARSIHPYFANPPGTHNHAAGWRTTRRGVRYFSPASPSESASSGPASPRRGASLHASRPSSPPSGLRSRAIGHERHRYHTAEDDAAWDVEEYIRTSRGPERGRQPKKSSERRSKGTTVGGDSKIEKDLGEVKADATHQQDEKNSDGKHDDVGPK